jgi:signal transduction histidine kinase
MLRGNYIRRKSLSGKGTELATNEYTLVEKKNYIRLKEDVLALHRLAQELRDAGISTTQSSEFVGIPKNVFDKLSKEVGEKKLLRLEREAFGYNTSMGGFDSEKVAIVLKNLIKG